MSRFATGFHTEHFGSPAAERLSVWGIWRLGCPGPEAEAEQLTQSTGGWQPTGARCPLWFVGHSNKYLCTCFSFHEINDVT